MRFPGSKLLSDDLSTKTTSFDDLVRHCEDVNLSGYLEIAFPDAEGILLFYLGEQINIIYRQVSKIFVSSEALLKLRNTAQLKEGTISILRASAGHGSHAPGGSRTARRSSVRFSPPTPSRSSSAHSSTKATLARSRSSPTGAPA